MPACQVTYLDGPLHIGQSLGDRKSTLDGDWGLDEALVRLNRHLRHGNHAGLRDARYGHRGGWACQNKLALDQIIRRLGRQTYP
jgi:hypothetical protein